jgi:ABC-type Fe3+-hydroxamate transport system substrate-binding protein
MNGRDKMKKILIYILLLTASVMFLQGFLSSPLYAGEYRTIIDMDDNKVEVPVNPQRIACMQAEKAYFLPYTWQSCSIQINSRTGI